MRPQRYLHFHADPVGSKHFWFASRACFHLWNVAQSGSVSHLLRAVSFFFFVWACLLVYSQRNWKLSDDERYVGLHGRCYSVHLIYYSIVVLLFVSSRYNINRTTCICWFRDGINKMETEMTVGITSLIWAFFSSHYLLRRRACVGVLFRAERREANNKSRKGRRIEMQSSTRTHALALLRAIPHTMSLSRCNRTLSDWRGDQSICIDCIRAISHLLFVVVWTSFRKTSRKGTSCRGSCCTRVLVTRFWVSFSIPLLFLLCATNSVATVFSFFFLLLSIRPLEGGGTLANILERYSLVFRLFALSLSLRLLL